MPSISMSISYRDERELLSAVAQQLGAITGHEIEVKVKTLSIAEFNNKVATGGYDGKPYDVQTLSERWNCSENFVRRMIKTGKLTAYKAGKRYIITPSNVRKYEGENL